MNKPEEPDHIIRIGTDEIEPVLTPLSQKMYLTLTKEWEQKIKTSTANE